jgi:uncharacterized metal-binding protein YceD (DUF177 family)
MTPMTAQPARPWSIPVSLDEVPETGRHFDLSADERVRTALAELAGLRSLPRLEAALDVTRHGRDGLRVAGDVSATVGQVCVVTLEPIENTVEEPIDLVFTPPIDLPPGLAREADAQGRQVEVMVEDAPEPLINGVVDLGAIVTEFLMLGIDPYPRKPDAMFESPAMGDDGGHPFAALAALKKGKGGE